MSENTKFIIILSAALYCLAQEENNDWKIYIIILGGGMKKDLLSIVAIAKNKGEYIQEWLEYHKYIGVDRIYLYDNESDDNLKDKIKKYIIDGYVIYRWFPGKGMQFKAYNNALLKYRNKTKYMAFIDCDEFLKTKNNEKIGELIDFLIKKQKNAFIGGLAINWCMFGSSHHDTKPDGLVIENYLYHAKRNGQGNNCVKSIVNPRTVLLFRHPHFPIFIPCFYKVDESGQKVLGWSNSNCKNDFIQINHYFTKSKEEWLKRRVLGKADHKNNEKRTLEEFYLHDNNDVFDDSMLFYANIIKKNLF